MQEAQRKYDEQKKELETVTTVPAAIELNADTL